jgi:hypothetical protein
MKKIYQLFFILLFLIFNSGFINATDMMVSDSLQLHNAINNVQGGDNIILQTGNYGKLLISNKNNSSAVVIKANGGATAVFTSVRISNSSYWALQGLNIKPRYSDNAGWVWAVDFDGSYLTIENCDINFADNTIGWTQYDWVSKIGNGISLDGTNLTALNNNITNIAFAISCSASYSLVSGNHITNFRGDGIRGLGDDDVYEYNVIKNC